MTEQELCNPVGGQCNRDAGHEGDHGMAVGGGLIIAPWPNVGPTEDFDSDLPCDICGTLMRCARGSDGGSFVCPSESCSQSYTFDPDGHSKVILGKMFPSLPRGAQDMSTDMRQELADYRSAEGVFLNRARVILGMIDQAEYDRLHQVDEDGLRDYWAELATLDAEADKPWFRRLYDTISKWKEVKA